jgi:hypothetical protein
VEYVPLEEIQTFHTHDEQLAMTAREHHRRGQAETRISPITIGKDLNSGKDGFVAGPS